MVMIFLFSIHDFWFHPNILDWLVHLKNIADIYLANQIVRLADFY